MNRTLRLLLGLGIPLLLGAGPVADEPRFTRHAQAVFSRLGCNGGTCHGSVKGQNGFRLSLFGPTQPSTTNSCSAAPPAGG